MLDDRNFSPQRCSPARVRPFHIRRAALIAMTFAAMAWCGSPGWCGDKPPEVEKAIKRAVGYFSSSSAIADSEAGLVVYTLIAAGESPDSPLVKKLTDVVLKKCGSNYKPIQHHNYEAGVDLMALVAADREKYKPQIQQISDFLIRYQKPYGVWDYHEGESKGDTSITQYGILGLWAASRAGIQVPLRVWDDAAHWHLQTQLSGGAFSYHPLGGDPAPKHSMTVAGVGSLAVIKLMLSKVPDSEPVPAADPESKPKKNDKAFGVLERVTPQAPTDAAPAATAAPPVDLNYKIGRAHV